MSGEGTHHRQSGRNLRLEDIMRPVVAVRPETTEREALKVLLENNVPGVPVVDEDGRLIGLVTDGHLLASALPKYLTIMEDVSFVTDAGDKWVEYFSESAERPVSEVMSTEVSNIELGTSEVVAAHKMVHDGVSSVIVTENGRVVGVVNRLDLYAAIIGAETE